MQQLFRISSAGVIQDEPCLKLHQSWRSTPEAGFQTGEVRVGWSPTALHIEATLIDRDIFNPVTTFNQPAFLSGDVFEIFLQAPMMNSYVELHIGPANQLYQVRIPSAGQFAACRKSGIPSEWLIQDPKVTTKVDLFPDTWEISAEIPVNMLGISEIEANQAWKMSFCRYDHMKNSENPILSSTSPLTEVDFHRINEWRSFLLV